MLVRAKNIGLMPGLQITCRHNLAELCSSPNGTETRGHELRCLQKNFKSLDPDCRNKLDLFNSFQRKDILLDDDMYNQCLPLSKTSCDDIGDLSNIF